MKRLGLLLIALVALAGCERKREPNKILDGYVVGSSEVIIPAEGARQFFLLKRDLLRVVVPVINKLSLATSDFSELSGPVAMKYSFQVSEKHYGTATFTLEFKDDVNATFDPIAVRGSSTTIKSVVVTGVGASALFPSISENLSLVLESSGVVTSTLRLNGTSVFSGSGYTLNFGFNPGGSKGVFEGITDGSASASGTGGTPPATASINLGFTTDRNANGSITWEGRDGGIHLDENGSGYVSTAAGRIFLQ